MAGTVHMGHPRHTPRFYHCKKYQYFRERKVVADGKLASLDRFLCLLLFGKKSDKLFNA